MIIVIASEVDEVAERAVATWPEGAARLLRPRDLCSNGWRVEIGQIAEAILVADGERISAARVTGVLNLMPYVFDRELVGIESADRRYVAAELMALLSYLLSQLKCPVLNRPSVNNLAGCDWRIEEWTYHGRQLGIPFVQQRIDSAAMQSQPIVEIMRTTVLDGKVVESGGMAHEARLVELARRADVAFVTFCYSILGSNYALNSVSLTPNLTNPISAAAVRSFFGTH